jgi:hypothetical protein
LLKKLEFARPDAMAAERELWTAISQFVLYDQPAPDSARSPSTEKAAAPAAAQAAQGAPAAPAPVAPAPPPPPPGLLQQIVSAFEGVVAVFWPPPPKPPGPAVPPPAPTPTAVLRQIAASPMPSVAAGPTRFSVVADWLVLAAVAAVIVMQGGRLSGSTGTGVRLGLAATQALPRGTEIKRSMVAFKLAPISSAPQSALITDPDAVTGRYTTRDIAEADMLRLTDLRESRELRVQRIEVSVLADPVAGTRGDVWLRSGGQFTTLLRDVEVVGVVPEPAVAGKPPAPTVPKVRTLFVRLPSNVELMSAQPDGLLFVASTPPRTQ